MRILAGWVKIWRFAIFASIWLGTVGPSLAAGSGKASPRSLYVGKISGEIGEALRKQIDDSIRRGFLTMQQESAGARGYDNLDTYEMIRDHDGNILVNIEELERALSNNPTGATVGHVTIPGKKFSHYLRVEVLRSEGEAIRVRMDVYDFKTWMNVASKSVGTCGSTDLEIVKEVESAASCLMRASCPSTPVAKITGAVVDGVEVGKEVILEGCHSYDQAYDRLTWSWSQESDGPVSVIAPGRPGEQLRFTPTVAGTYKFRLRVRQLNGPGSADATQEVRVLSRPHARAGESRIVTWADPTRITLDGSKSTPHGEKVEVTWRQIHGPIAKFRGEFDSYCRTESCGVEAPVPGLYVFRLEVRNGALPPEHDDVSYLVADAPRIDFTFCAQDTKGRVDGTSDPVACSVKTVPNRPLQLGAQVRSDEIDRAPTVTWRFTGENPKAVLVDPYSFSPTFEATDFGVYTIEITSRVRREIEGRELWKTAKTKATVHVVPATKTYFLAQSLQVPISTTHTPFLTPALIGFVGQPSLEVRLGYRFSLGLGRIPFASGEPTKPDPSFTAAMTVLVSRQPTFELWWYLGGHVAYRYELYSILDGPEGGPETGLQMVGKPFAHVGVVADAAIRPMFWRGEPYGVFHLSLGVGTFTL
jgi:hypothetical protein